MSTLTQLASLPQLEAQRLFDGYVEHFKEQDSHLIYLHSERKATLQLTDGIWIVGTLDAEGIRTTDSKAFFRDDKTSNPKWKGKWKADWAMSPQALTYGVLSGEREPRFLVRKAFKSAPATFEQEWFRFTRGELDWWREQLLIMAMEIRSYRTMFPRGKPWPMNTKHGCFAYGKDPRYVCKFYGECCTRREFGRVPGGVMRGDEHMGEYLALLPPLGPSDVVLNSSRIEHWMRCRELARRMMEDKLSEVENEAMLIGKLFHQKLEGYTKELIERKEN